MGSFFLRLVRDGHHVVLAEDATVRSVMPRAFITLRSQAVRGNAKIRPLSPVRRPRMDRREAARPQQARGRAGPLFPPFTVLAAAAILMLPIALYIGSLALLVIAVSSLDVSFYVLRGATLVG